MIKTLLELLNILALILVVVSPFLETKGRSFLALGILSLQVLLSSAVAVVVFLYGSFNFSYVGSWITGAIPVRIDYLSAWFMLVISFTFLTGAWYGIQYLKKYREQKGNLALHAIAYIFAYTSLMDICVVQNGMVLLVVWEIMALSAFVTIIFEHYKTETLKAGINYLIQSHVGILFLSIAFMWIKVKTGSFDFIEITTFTATQSALIGIGLFLFFYIGFAIKAGFVPFHTWLPLAHPAAPAHISGVMSGVIIKIGIYGILRFLLLIRTDMVAIGYFVLFTSVITGVYGVMLAIVQHNLKKLLAYHSIENIGIIGIGIGLACIGIGYNNQVLLVAGMGGALLHTLNHSLFKSLLFFTAGNVYQVTHTMNIEALGGLIKKMPQTAYLFLIGSLAICGLPPFNGFVSEFFIYSGLFNGLLSNYFMLILSFLFSILGLVLIGGLAMICFTKAFGIVFLGSPRKEEFVDIPKEKLSRILPLYFIAGAIVFIGVFPFLLSPVLQKVIGLYPTELNQNAIISFSKIAAGLTLVGWYSLGFIFLTLILFFLRFFIIHRRQNRQDVTWGCGYMGETTKMQYTASSFIRTYRKLAGPALSIKKDKKEVSGLYPGIAKHHTHPGDRLENWLIDSPLFFIRRFLNRFMFLQNGNIQIYILYGFIFIGLAILLPLLIKNFAVVVNFLNQL